MHEDPIDSSPKDDDISGREGPKAPNQRTSAKRNRLSGPARRAFEDLCFVIWEATSADPSFKKLAAAMLAWKARNL